MITGILRIMPPRRLAALCIALPFSLFSQALYAQDKEGTSAVTLAPAAIDVWDATAPMLIAGQAKSGSSVLVQAREPKGDVVFEATLTADPRGRFQRAVPRADLPAGPLTLRAGIEESSGGKRVWSADSEVYNFPVIQPEVTLPSVKREGRYLVVDGERWAFVGLNYTRFLLQFSLQTDFRVMAEEFRTYGEWGLDVLRVPLHLGMFQPAPGVFPDDSRYAGILLAHKLDPRFFELFEYAVALAGHHGMRLVFDWHEMPTDPYRYFVGGNMTEKQAGLPGKGIAWLYDRETGQAAVPGDPRFDQAIADTNRWLARHFRGNGNILGFEVPYNEPHSITDSSGLAWRRLTASAIRPIVAEDPERLTFGMPPAWGHSNVLPSVTWLAPDELSGMTPHHYLGNGPIPYRDGADQYHEPWLAREIDAVFDHSFYAVALPTSAAEIPFWNGESGEHGYRSFLPELSHREASSLMIEAQLVQAYAAGWVGSLGWTLTGHATVFEPIADIHEAIYRRFSEVYAAGPVDMDRAEVLFVQNTAAVPVANGLNHACVPFARLALDLHLEPVHYMTDDQLLYSGLVQMAVGLEQVEQIATGLRYKAAVVDTRNLDHRALELLQGSGIPLLVIDDAEALTREQMAAFLKAAGLELDERTPSELQLIEGPGHLLVYRRSGDGEGRIFPRLQQKDRFQLVDENGVTVFTGTAAELADNGLEIRLEKWRTAIFRIQ